MVNRAEYEELFRRWRAKHDPREREELVGRFLPLACKLAHRYAGTGEPFEDLLQVASLALIKAIDRFDPGRGTAFSSFAVPTILGELKRHFRDFGWSVQVTRGAQERALKVQAAHQQLTIRHGRSPTVNQLAESLELSVEQVLDALETAAAHHTASFDAPRNDHMDEPQCLHDVIGETESGYEIAEQRVTIAISARELSHKERQILSLRFGNDMTQTEIAAKVGVSQMQVSRVLRRTLARLRELTENNDGNGRLIPRPAAAPHFKPEVAAAASRNRTSS